MEFKYYEAQILSNVLNKNLQFKELKVDQNKGHNKDKLEE